MWSSLMFRVLAAAEPFKRSLPTPVSSGNGANVRTFCLDHGGGRIKNLTDIRFAVIVAVDSNVPTCPGDL